MNENRRHIKPSKGERLRWVEVSNQKNTVVYSVSLESKLFKNVRFSEVKNIKATLNSNHNLLVP